MAGDTLNDLSMLSLGLPAVAVGNSEPDLVAALEGQDHVHFASGERRGRHRRGHSRLRRPAAAPPPEKGEPPPCHRISSSSITASPTKRWRRAAASSLKENSSPNGIVPTLKSFFRRGGSRRVGGVETGRGPVEPRVRAGHRNRRRLRQVLGFAPAAVGASGPGILPCHLERGVLADPCIPSRNATTTTPWTGPNFPRGELGLRRGRRRRGRRRRAGLGA